MAAGTRLPRTTGVDQFSDSKDSEMRRAARGLLPDDRFWPSADNRTNRHLPFTNRNRRQYANSYLNKNRTPVRRNLNVVGNLSFTTYPGIKKPISNPENARKLYPT